MKTIFLIMLFVSGAVFAASGHDHEKKKTSVKKSHDHDHEDEHSSEDDHDHDHDKKKEKKEDEDHDHGDEHGDDDGHAHSEGEGDHDDHGSSKAVGEGKAITEVDEKKGFSMSEEALNFMGVEFKNAISSNFEIPANALVVNRNETGFYRLRKGFLNFVHVKDVLRRGDTIEINDSGWKFGDRIVISKVDLIRVSDVYSKDKSNYGHAH